MINANELNEGTVASPVFICDINGDFLIANKYAKESAHISLLQTNIANYISSEDALRYDFIMKCKKPRPFIAAAKLVCGNGFLCIVPNKISDCRIAIVVIKKTLRDAESFVSTCNVDLLNNVQLFMLESLNYIDISKTSCYTNALFDTEKAALLIASKMTAKGLTPLSFNIHSPEGICSSEAFMCDLGLDSFISIFTSVVFAFDTISANSKVDITLSNSEGAFSIVFETDYDEGFVFENDSFNKNLDFLRFAFECSNCDFDISTDNSKIKIICTFSDIADDIDFKSNDPFACFDAILEKSVARLQSIYKEANQAKGLSQEKHSSPQL